MLRERNWTVEDRLIRFDVQKHNSNFEFRPSRAQLVPFEDLDRQLGRTVAYVGQTSIGPRNPSRFR